MKKIISILLASLMLFAVMAPAVSAVEERTPIINIRGNGFSIYYPDGTPVAARIEDLSLGGEGEEDGIDKDVIVETAVNILKPFVLEGMLFDKWDNYGQALYDEISPLFKDAGLDGNGNPTNETGMLKSEYDRLWNISKSSYFYSINEPYMYPYDWRLSPYDHIEKLDEFVNNVLGATGKSQVSIYARCIGGGALMAYLDWLEEKGQLGKIKNVMFSEVLSNEATVISKSFSGQIEFDAKMVERYTGQLDFCGEIGEGIGFAFTDVLYEIVFKTMDFFNQINVTDTALDGVEDLYKKLYKALIPAALHATGLGTQLSYWCCVAEEDMDAALDLVFGKEGTETRTEYAGFIEKVQEYRSKVSSNLDGFYKMLDDKGIHYGFFAKYGLLNAPLTVDADIPSDALVSFEHAAYGATAAKIGQTLSDSYIASLGEKAKYVSPDKQVDVSTCIHPDRVWVVKNIHHSRFDKCWNIVRDFLNGTNETVDTLGYPQYQVYDYETDSFSPMTAENSADFEFITKPVEKPTTETRVISFVRFFTMIINFFTKLFKGELDLGNLFG